MLDDAAFYAANSLISDRFSPDDRVQPALHSADEAGRRLPKAAGSAAGRRVLIADAISSARMARSRARHRHIPSFTHRAEQSRGYTG
jgi:hypothetical protein